MQGSIRRIVVSSPNAVRIHDFPSPERQKPSRDLLLVLGTSPRNGDEHHRWNEPVLYPACIKGQLPRSTQFAQSAPSWHSRSTLSRRLRASSLRMPRDTDPACTSPSYPSSPMHMPQGVSVTVATHNSAPLLHISLQSLRRDFLSHEGEVIDGVAPTLRCESFIRSILGLLKNCSAALNRKEATIALFCRASW